MFGSSPAYQPRPYLRAVLAGHWVCSIAAGTALGVAAVLAWAKGLEMVAVSLACLAVAQAFILFYWLVRRACYLRLQPRQAAGAALGYLLLMVLTLVLLRQSDLLSVPTALGSMGLCSLLAGLWLVHRWQGMGAGVSGSWRQMARDHWRYGRWAILVALVGYLPGQIYYFLFNLEDSASLKALLNMVLPAMQAGGALSILLVPWFVARLQSRSLGRYLSNALLAVSLPLAGYWLALGLLHGPIVQTAYGGRYQSQAGLFWIIGAVPALSATMNVLAAVLRAAQKPNRIFAAFLTSAVVAVCVGAVLARWLGLSGAAIGLVASYGAGAVAMAVACRGLRAVQAAQVVSMNSGNVYAAGEILQRACERGLEITFRAEGDLDGGQRSFLADFLSSGRLARCTGSAGRRVLHRRLARQLLAGESAGQVKAGWSPLAILV